MLFYELRVYVHCFQLIIFEYNEPNKNSTLAIIASAEGITYEILHFDIYMPLTKLK